MTIPGTEQWTINECLDYIDYGIDEGDSFEFLSGTDLEMLKDGDDQDDEWHLD